MYVIRSTPNGIYISGEISYNSAYVVVYFCQVLFYYTFCFIFNMKDNMNDNFCI